MFIRDTAVAVAVGAILLLTLGRLIGRVQFSLSMALWGSFIGHIFIIIIGLFTGFVFSRHMAIGLIIALVIGWAFQTYVPDSRSRGEWNSPEVEGGYSFGHRHSWRLLCSFTAHRTLGPFPPMTATPNCCTSTRCPQFEGCES